MGTSILVYSSCILLTIFATAIRRGSLRQVLLLVGSYIFYASFGTTFLAVLVTSSLLNFACGEFLRRNPTLTRLWIGVGANIALLGFFKTTHILALMAGPSSSVGHILSGIAMPLGVSFWTFQALSYLFDIYRQEEIDPTLLEFCLYMAFWPTVVMGPICRLGNMLPQLRTGPPFSASDLMLGSKRIVIGLFMKLVLSQLLLAGWAANSGISAAFDRGVTTSSGLDVWLLAIGFGFQLFFDFAGYSHIVIGLARIFGFRLDENFDAPFLASTPSEFWNRWHMSLSSWIRDYVFIPVAAARRDISWRYFALLFSMALFGLWHGAKGTFVLWGVYQGILLVCHRIIQRVRRNTRIEVPRILDGFSAWIVSFLAVSLGWILFRSNGLDQAWIMFKAVFAPRSYLHPTLPSSDYVLVAAVLLGYFSYQKLAIPAARRISTILSLESSYRLNRWGITKDFATLAWLIPMIAILFLGVLIAYSGTESVSTFAYSVF